jgi:polysaccharide export outer membrane protein
MKRPAFNPIFRFLLLAALGGGAAAGAWAQTAGSAAPATLSFRIITNDQIGVHVFGEEDLTTVQRVDAKGEINCILINQIHIAGLTIAEAERVIADAYKSGQYLLHPIVTLSVEGLAPREVSVQGMVKSPGRFDLKIESGTTLLDIISKAGGFTDTAQGKSVKLTRVGPDGTPQVFTRDVESVMKGKEQDKEKIKEANMLLEPGDVIYVPERII